MMVVKRQRVPMLKIVNCLEVMLTTKMAGSMGESFVTLTDNTTPILEGKGTLYEPKCRYSSYTINNDSL